MIPSGWFEIPGVQQGERTLESQLHGLDPLWESIEGATVLDLGCAEGLIAMECKKRGASYVDAIDYKATFIGMAKEIGGRSGVEVNWMHADLQRGMPHGTLKQYDVVLALAIIHKMTKPIEFVNRIAQLAKSLIVVRLPVGSTGTIKSKHWPYAECNIKTILQLHGFDVAGECEGPNTELVQYYVMGESKSV